MERKSGILLPISSLPSKYGIGCFSKEAYEFVDQLVKAGQTYWQILPLGPTGYGDSPYQSFSTFAGNPYFIDLDELERQKLISKEDYDSLDFCTEEDRIDYGKQYENRLVVLRKAFSHFNGSEDPEYVKFCDKEAWWLDDYCMYMALKQKFGGISWGEWDTPIRMRENSVIEAYRKLCAEDMEFYRFLQYEFSCEWYKLKKYANDHGIKIIGDIPIYVSFDSADSWASPELFQFDEDRRPVKVAGCPPDAFSADGQLWGNPLYAWDRHETDGFAWWIRRMKHCFRLYDIVRIDHFRGFDEYFAIPAGDSTAIRGQWEKGPGMKLFNAIKESIGTLPVIAEDLGYLTDSVIQLVKDSGFPGMKVMEFAFDSREPGDYMPYHYTSNTVVYTGTHDNQTLLSWYDELTEEDRQMISDYLCLDGRSRVDAVWAMIRLTLACVSDTAIIPIQDYLCKGAEGRMNHPSTLGGNWTWRMKAGELTEELLSRIAHLTKIYGRS